MVPTATNKANPFIAGNQPNKSISTVPRCCHFSVGCVLATTAPELMFQTANIMSILKQTNQGWTKSTFGTELASFDYADKRNSDFSLIIACFMVPGRFNLELDYSKIPQSSMDLSFFESCLAKACFSYSTIRSRSMLTANTAHVIERNIMNAACRKGVLTRIEAFDNDLMPLMQTRVTARNVTRFSRDDLATISTQGVSAGWYQGDLWRLVRDPLTDRYAQCPLRVK